VITTKEVAILLIHLNESAGEPTTANHGGVLKNRGV